MYSQLMLLNQIQHSGGNLETVSPSKHKGGFTIFYDSFACRTTEAVFRLNVVLFTISDSPPSVKTGWKPASTRFNFHCVLKGRNGKAKEKE